MKEVIDPVANAAAAVSDQKLRAVINREPLTSWFQALIEQKINNLRTLTWSHIVDILHNSAIAVAESEGKAKIKVNGELRLPTPAEVDACRAYAKDPIKERALKLQLERNYKELHARHRAALTGGTG